MLRISGMPSPRRRYVPFRSPLTVVAPGLLYRADRAMVRAWPQGTGTSYVMAVVASGPHAGRYFSLPLGLPPSMCINNALPTPCPPLVVEDRIRQVEIVAILAVGSSKEAPPEILSMSNGLHVGGVDAGWIDAKVVKNVAGRYVASELQIDSPVRRSVVEASMPRLALGSRPHPAPSFRIDTVSVPPSSKTRLRSSLVPHASVVNGAHTLTDGTSGAAIPDVRVDAHANTIPLSYLIEGLTE